jgi:hypothetical protein
MRASQLRTLIVIAGLMAPSVLPGCQSHNADSADLGEAANRVESQGAAGPTLAARLVQPPKVTQAPPQAAPPAPDSGENANVEVTLTGIQMVDPAAVQEKPQAGQGHLHYQVDSGPIVATTATKLGFHQMEPGRHTIQVILAANDHTPLGPRATLLVGTVPETGSGGIRTSRTEAIKSAAEMPEKTSSTTAAVLAARLIDAERKALGRAATVEVDVTGIELVDPVSVNLVPSEGQGHLHYRVDEGPVVATTVKKLSFHELAPGRHAIMVMLAANDHSPLGPSQSLTLTVPESPVAE